MSNINYVPYLYNKPKSPRHHSKAHGSVVVAMVFILSLGICLYSIFAPTISSATADITYYAVCQGNYDTIVEARSYVDSLQSQNGAGYVMSNNDAYTLVCAIYSTKDNATSVANHNINTFVKDIPIYNPTIENIDIDTIDDIYSTLDSLYQDLYTLSNDIDSDNITYDNARSTISRLVSTIDEYKTTNIDNVYLNTLIQSVSYHLNTLYSGVLTSSSVRYCYCALVNARMM